jgi:phage regulator Rha-like protein
MKQEKLSEKVESINSNILTIRGMKVILDSDLASLYGVETKMLNRAVKRNISKFPADFAFRLSQEQVLALRCQNGTSNGRGGQRYPPFAFTEHGAIMAANVLRSQEATEMSVFIVRAFIKMREALLSRHETEERLSQIENILLVHDQSLSDIYEQIRPLLMPPDPPAKKEIGF